MRALQQLLGPAAAEKLSGKLAGELTAVAVEAQRTPPPGAARERVRPPGSPATRHACRQHLCLAELSVQCRASTVSSRPAFPDPWGRNVCAGGRRMAVAGQPGQQPGAADRAGGRAASHRAGRQPGGGAHPAGRHAAAQPAAGHAHPHATQRCVVGRLVGHHVRSRTHDWAATDFARRFWVAHAGWKTCCGFLAALQAAAAGGRRTRRSAAAAGARLCPRLPRSVRQLAGSWGVMGGPCTLWSWASVACARGACL
jgi:hypothetical protein